LLAGLHLENNQFLEADGHMAVLLDQQPNAPMVLVRKAKCLRSMAQGDAATVLLNKALAIQPKYPPALLELAQLAYHEARFEEAEQLVRESRERDSADRTALHLLVLCQRALGKTTEADANAKLEIKMDAMLERLRNITTKDLPSTPHDANLHAELGDIFLKIGQYADGERWYRSALSRQPNHLASLVALKDYYMDMGLTRQAEEYRLRWERAKSEGPK
jgi:Tfp pilus assembly protein PilF